MLVSRRAISLTHSFLGANISAFHWPISYIQDNNDDGSYYMRDNTLRHYSSNSTCLIKYSLLASTTCTWLLLLVQANTLHCEMHAHRSFTCRLKTFQMPSLMAPKPQGKWWIYFLLQNIGFLLGLAIMLVISVYEGKLVHME